MFLHSFVGQLIINISNTPPPNAPQYYNMITLYEVLNPVFLQWTYCHNWPQNFGIWPRTMGKHPYDSPELYTTRDVHPLAPAPQHSIQQQNMGQWPPNFPDNFWFKICIRNLLLSYLKIDSDIGTWFKI